MNSRNRTPSEYIGYGLYFYFSGLSLRRTSERLACFVKRNHVSIWNWIQKYNHQKIASKKKKVDEFVIDETVIRVGSKVIWLWVAIEPKYRPVLTLSIYLQGKKHVCGRTIPVRLGQDSWKASCFNGWGNLVSNGLSIPETKTPYPFPF